MSRLHRTKPPFLRRTDSLTISTSTYAGYLVISPDYFYGEQVAELNENPNFTLSDFIPKWLVKMDDGQGNQVQKTTLLLREWMPRVKQMFGNPDTKYGIVGFCFGAPYVLDYCSYSRYPPMLNTRDQKLKSPPLFLLVSRHNQ